MRHKLCTSVRSSNVLVVYHISYIRLYVDLINLRVKTKVQSLFSNTKINTYRIMRKQNMFYFKFACVENYEYWHYY